MQNKMRLVFEKCFKNIWMLCKKFCTKWNAWKENFFLREYLIHVKLNGTFMEKGVALYLKHKLFMLKKISKNWLIIEIFLDVLIHALILFCFPQWIPTSLIS